ncbi:MAG TPA: vitamin K epoxide reductase family protein [Mucilaginibacter sp.]|nr:vitamin K epoxide reductase family protein [Mucilaginibacter sp.]
MQLFDNQNNADSVVISLLKELAINIKSEDIIAELEKHPDYPSMLAISDVLNWFDIDNAAYRIDTGEVKDVPVPFIAHTRLNDFVSISKITGDQVTLSDNKRKNYKMPLAGFENLFDGVVLTITPSLSGYDTSKQNRTSRLSEYRRSGAFMLLGIVFFIVLFNSHYVNGLSWQAALLTIIKMTGVFVSMLLLVQSIDQNNPLIQTLCSGKGKSDCNAILSSKAAKVFEGLSWSEVGFFYFTGSLLALFFSKDSTAGMQILAFFNIVSLPYTVYSIYYQARVAKQWCVLCCTVQGLLWLEFFPLVTFLSQPIVAPGPGQWLTVLACFMVPIALWLLIRPLFLKAQQLKTLKPQLQKFKYNKELFDATLQTQPKYALPSKEWSIVLGNAESDTIIIMVSNPYCPPCSKTHQELDTWLHKLENIQLRIVFTANNTDGDNKTPVVRHLMALNEQGDQHLMKRALHDWYAQKQKNLDAWAKAYPVQPDENKFYKLEKQSAWCEMAEVTGTPTLLVNGYRLPQVYQVQDIKYMLA